MPEGSKCYWIDETEVTVSEYAKFLEAFVESAMPLQWGVDAESKACGDWKSAPSNPAQDPDCIAATDGEDDPFGEKKPIRCVDWCDAVAFCNWAGKNLCASEVSITSVNSGQRSIFWTSGCSEGKANYPYGGSKLDETACNIGLERSGCNNFLMHPCGPTYVPSPPPLHCMSPVGAVDMIGNVAEWVANCGTNMLDSSPQAQPCTIRGGSFLDDTSIHCKTPKYRARATLASDVGFRCCAGE